MLTTDQVRRIKLKKLKKKYRYSTGGSGRRFLLGFALRQLGSHGKIETCKKASTKRGAVWTVISTSQATDSFPKDASVEDEDISEVQCEESLVQDEDSLDNHKVKDTPSDQFLLPASFMANGARTSPSGSQNLPQDDSRTSAWSSVQCPLLEPAQFFNSFKSKGLQFLEDIEAHVSTQNSNCHHPPPLKNLVFGEPLHGTTPLLLACHYGDLSWVTRILEDWNVDVNAAGVYFLDPLCRYESKIARATPLFVAAFNGHTSIVEYLVGKGADVASKTSCDEFVSHYDGMTPLYGAFNQRCVSCVKMVDATNIVRFLLQSGADLNDVPSHKPPIWTSLMCGVDATTALIQHGLDLEQLGSLLRHWVNAQSNRFDPYRKRDSIDVVKLLVQKGASIMAKDNKGFSMLLAAVKNQNWNCVDYFLEKEGVDPMEKIEAAEMAGAIILSTTSNKLEFERAFKYWRLAPRLRQTEPGLKQKTALILKSGQAGEWISSNQLEIVINHPEEYQFQSFLVRLRICSNKTWRDVLELHQDSFSDCIGDLKKQDRLVDLFDLLWVTLETIHHSPNYEPDYDLRSMIDNVFESFITTLSLLEMNHPLLNAKTLNLPLEVMVDANDFVFSDDESDSIDSDDNWSYSSSDHQNHPHMSILLQLFAFLAGLCPYESLTPAIREALRRLVLKNNLAHNKRTLLHMACGVCFEADDLPTIRLLLLSGADPNAVDKYGDAPLHVLAYHTDENDAVIQSAAHLLLDYGAQLERANDDGETPAHVWIRGHAPEAGMNEPPEWCIKPVTVPNLKSLCVRVFRSRDIPYDELQLPATLITLVEMRKREEKR